MCKTCLNNSGEEQMEQAKKTKKTIRNEFLCFFIIFLLVAFPCSCAGLFKWESNSDKKKKRKNVNHYDSSPPMLLQSASHWVKLCALLFYCAGLDRFFNFIAILIANYANIFRLWNYHLKITVGSRFCSWSLLLIEFSNSRQWLRSISINPRLHFEQIERSPPIY